MQNIVSPFHKERGEHMGHLMEFAADILGKHGPVEGVNVKADAIVDKIKLVEIPEGIFHEDWEETIEQVDEEGNKTEEKLQRTKNTGEAGILVLKVPQIEEEEVIPIEVTGAKDGEEKKEGEEPAAAEEGKEAPKEKKVKRLVDEDQQQKAVAIQFRDIAGMKENNCYYAINEYAGKLIREDFLDFINKMFPEFFEDNDDFDKINQAVNKLAVEEQDAFIKKHCDEYTFPCMVFEVNAVDL